MSAWLVSKGHIDALVWAFLEYSPGAIDTSEIQGRDDLGQLLMSECWQSVEARYGKHAPDDPLPGCWEHYSEPYQYTPPAKLPNIYESHKNIACYIYQSCEHRTWGGSLARRLVCDLRQEISRLLGLSEEGIASLPQWQQAPWGWGED